MRTAAGRTVAMACALVLAGCGAGSTARPASSGVTDDGLVGIGAGLRGPAGLQAAVYATGLDHLSALVTDAQRRLWAATADASDSGTDGIYLVTGGHPQLVVDDVRTPMGLLWYGQSLYVASLGRVDAYSDFDGTRFANHRSVVSVPDAGSSGGLVLAPDGRLQLGISAPCDSCTPSSPWSASVVSFLPDGSDLRVDAAGIRAPVGLAYVPGTADLLVTMNQRDDLGDATPGDWLSVVRQGQDWGFPDCYGQAGAACAGAPAPMAELDKHAAVSGVAVVTGQLGPTVGTSAIVAEWAFGKVQRVALAPTPGGGYSAVVSPFLAGLQSPVPVLLGPDGALLVGDWATGTVYTILPAP